MAMITGLNAVKQSKTERERAKLRASGSFRRYRLKRGERGKITFLDKPLVGTFEHSVKRSDKIYEQVWCSNNENGEGSCPHCAAGIPRSYVLVGTVINHNKYDSKDGTKTYQNQKQYIVLKGNGQQAMLEFLDPDSPEYMDVQFQHFSVKRPDSQTACSSGEIFTPKGKVSLAKLKALAPEGEDPDEYIQPLDYNELLANVDSTDVFGGSSGIGDNDAFADLTEDEETDDTSEGDVEDEDTSVQALI